jgi:hypothetical protein
MALLKLMLAYLYCGTSDGISSRICRVDMLGYYFLSCLVGHFHEGGGWRLQLIHHECDSCCCGVCAVELGTVLYLDLEQW